MITDKTSAMADWAKETRKNSGWLIFLGVLTIILGVIAIASPYITGLTVTVIVGVSLLFSSIARIVGAFKADSFGQGALAFVGGLLTGAAGLIMVLRPGLGLATLTLILAATFVLDGATSVILSFKMKPEKGWGSMLFHGVVAVLLGILLLANWPLSGLYAVGILAGIEIIMSGLTMVSIGRSARSVANEAA